MEFDSCCKSTNSVFIEGQFLPVIHRHRVTSQEAFIRNRGMTFAVSQKRDFESLSLYISVGAFSSLLENFHAKN